MTIKTPMQSDIDAIIEQVSPTQAASAPLSAPTPTNELCDAATNQKPMQPGEISAQGKALAKALIGNLKGTK